MVVGVAALPIDWSGITYGLAMTAAGMRQPANAARLLEQRLQAATVQEVLSEQRPSATLPTASAPDVPVDAPVQEDGIQTLPVLSATPPGEKGDGGKILTKTLDKGKEAVAGVALLNRSGKTVDVAAALNRSLTQRFEKSDQPQVLLVHTHTTEQYMLYDAGYYNAGDRDRTGDQRQNVCAVGKAIAAQLEAAGIRTIHDTTVHDSPQYSGAYTRSAETVADYLAKYPSIKVVLDVHRDAIMDSDTTLTKPTVEIGGKKAAQVMIITGVVSTGELPHPNWEQNLTLAAKWQQALSKAYPGLMRPLYTVASRYNQHLSPGYLLVEVGSEGNTVEEVTYSAQLLGKTLATLLS